jgi:hypothetical protein
MTGSENTQEKVGLGNVSLPDLCLAERVCVIPDKMTKETAKIFRYFIFCLSEKLFFVKFDKNLLFVTNVF